MILEHWSISRAVLNITKGTQKMPPTVIAGAGSAGAATSSPPGRPAVTGSRLGAASLAAAGILFALYPLLRPWHDESAVAGAVASMSSPAWVAAHFFAMLGFRLVPLGLLAVRGALAGTRLGPLAQTAIVVTWAGAGLVLPYYGAEDFGLHAIASQHANGLLSLIQAVRYQPLAATMFGAGLVLLAVGSVLVAVAIWRSRVLPRYGGVVFAVGFVLFLPQFYLPPAGRIAHGLVLAAGLAVLAASLWRARARTA